MFRLIATLLVSLSLVFGTTAAQAHPHHPISAAMQSGGPMMPMDGCVHGKAGHKGALCPMLSCFPSVPFFLAPAKFGAPSPAAHGMVTAEMTADVAVVGATIDTDPPVPRLLPI